MLRIHTPRVQIRKIAHRVDRHRRVELREGLLRALRLVMGLRDRLQAIQPGLPTRSVVIIRTQTFFIRVSKRLDQALSLLRWPVVVGPGQRPVAVLIELLHLWLVVRVVRPLQNRQLRRRHHMLYIRRLMGRPAMAMAAGNKAKQSSGNSGNNERPARSYKPIHQYVLGSLVTNKSKLRSWMQIFGVRESALTPPANPRRKSPASTPARMSKSTPCDAAWAISASRPVHPQTSLR